MTIHKLTSTYLPCAVLPFLPLSPHESHRAVMHPLVSLVVVGAIFVLIYRAFRRKPS